MSLMPTEPIGVAKTPSLLVLLLPGQPCSQPVVEPEESDYPVPSPQVLKTDNDATPAQQGGEEITFIKPLLCAKYFIHMYLI